MLHERLSAEYQDVEGKVGSEMQRGAEGSEEGKESSALDELIEERNAVLAKFAEAAKTYAGTEGAVPFNTW
ncbi:MAG: hypothetical protein ACJA2W_000395 [Planctomycetota bacterium]